MKVPIGTPYRPGARGPDAYDCWGLVLAELSALPLPDFSGRKRRELDRLKGEAICSQPWEPVWPPLPGDVVLMGTSRRLRHAGVCVAGGIKHVAGRVGVVVESLGALRQAYSHLEAWRWAG